MYSNAHLSKLPIEVIRIMYTREIDGLNLIAKEEENGWITVIPIMKGKQLRSFRCIDFDVALKAMRRKFKLEGELKAEDFGITIESTDFAGEASQSN